MDGEASTAPGGALEQARAAFDALWRQAPMPALWVSGTPEQPRWQANAAAREWAARLGLDEAVWRAVAGRAWQCPPGAGPVPMLLGTPPVVVDMHVVQPSTGRLVWLQRADAVVDGRLSASDLLGLLQEHGRMGCLVRDLDSGIGFWDARVFEIMGVSPADGTPDWAGAMALIHPDDRPGFLAQHQQRRGQAGRYSHHFRILRPDGGLRYLKSIYEMLPARDGRGPRLVSLLIDETEAVVRYRAERETSDELASVLQMAGLSVWRVDVARGRVEFNDEGYRLLGLVPRPEGLALADLLERIHPDDVAQVRRAADEATRSHCVVDVMARYGDGQGGWRQLLTRRVARRGPDGEVQALLGVSLDLTALTHERARSLALLDRVRLATEAIGVGFWWRDLDRGTLEWDERMFRLHHRDPAEGTPSLDEFLERHIHPADRELLRRRQAQHIAEWPESSEITFRILTPEGDTRWIQTWTRRHWRDGRRLSFGMHVDVTHEREAQQAVESERERDRFAIEAAGVGVWEQPLGRRPGHWSASLYRLYGVSPDDPRPPAALMAAGLGPQAHEAARQGLRACLRGRRDYRAEHEVRWPDGTRRWLLVQGRLQRDAAGRRVALTGVAVDVTERREAERLARERDRAEQANAAKSALMARVSHELRTPMNAVLGFTELMALDSLAPAQRERLARIRAAGGHLMGLIDDLLALSQADSQLRPTQREPVALAEVLADAVQWLSVLAQAGQVQVHAQQALGSAACVEADRRRLGQVLTNLLSNAIKYNRAGGQVWIELHAAELAGRPAWCVRVRDDGRGLSPEQQAHLFEPFNRLGAERDGIPGTGIGLAIVRQLMSDMAGELTLRSAPGQGSEFRVTLPAAAAGVAPTPQVAPAAVASPAPRPAAEGGTVPVLYVEDNPVNELLVRQMLALRPRYRLESAEDGRQGLALAAQQAPRIVLLDMQLPDGHGLELVQRMRALPVLAGARFVALSANAMPEDVQAALDGGFDAYWTKPLEVARFLEAMDAQAALLAPG